MTLPKTSGADHAEHSNPWPIEVREQMDREARAFIRRARAKRTVEQIEADLPVMRTLELDYRQRLEAATTDEEKERATGLLNDIRQQIAEAERTRKVTVNTQKAKDIRARRNEATSRLAAALAASQHEGYTQEFRDAERDRITREYEEVNRRAEAEMQAWLAEQAAEANRLYHSDPEGDTASETRRLRRIEEVKAITERYAGKEKMLIENHVLAEAQRFVAMGAMDRAQTFYEAAQRLGVEDGGVAQAIEQHLDRTLPHRKDARQMRLDAVAEAQFLGIDAARGRLIHGIGTPTQQVRDQTVVKLAEYKEPREADLLREQGLEPPVYSAS